MITKILNDREIQIPNSWEDITTLQFAQLTELYEKVDILLEEAFLVKFINILCGLTEEEINNSYEDDLMIFTEIMDCFSFDKFKPTKTNHFILNGNLYSYNASSKMTMGEKISIKLLEKTAKTNAEIYLNLLSIVIRPAKESINEFGETIYEIEKFNSDIEIINKRKELIKNIPAINSIWIIQSFMNGNAIYQ